MKLLNAQMPLRELIGELQKLEDQGFGKEWTYFYCKHCGADMKIKDGLEVGVKELDNGELRVVIELDI